MKPIPEKESALDLNFNESYGKEYRGFIRKMIPGYDQRLELLSDILASSSSNAKNRKKKVLVIGPGYGEELIGMAHAIPDTHITAFEASAEMAKAAQHLVEREGLESRVTIVPKAFGDADNATPESQSYDAVTLLNVLHLMPREQHLPLLRQAARCVAPDGGIVLISGISLPENYDSNHPLHVTANSRWKRLGIREDLRNKIHNSIGQTLFSLSEQDLEIELQSSSDSKESTFTLLHEMDRSLANVLWYSQKSIVATSHEEEPQCNDKSSW